MVEQTYKITKRIDEHIINEIVEVEKTKGLTAENLLEVAECVDSPLHNLFEWNDTEAANEYRLYQARAIINEVKIIVGEKIMYAYENVSIKVGNSSERVYKPINEIINNIDFKNQMLKRALENIKYWKNQYAQFGELNLIFQAIDKTDRRLNKKWKKAKVKIKK